MSDQLYEAYHRGPIFKSIDQYITYKLDMLQNEFYIRLTERDIFDMCNLTTEEDVNSMAHRIILERL